MECLTEALGCRSCFRSKQDGRSLNSENDQSKPVGILDRMTNIGECLKCSQLISCFRKPRLSASEDNLTAFSPVRTSNELLSSGILASDKPHRSALFDAIPSLSGDTLLRQQSLISDDVFCIILYRRRGVILPKYYPRSLQCMKSDYDFNKSFFITRKIKSDPLIFLNEEFGDKYERRLGGTGHAMHGLTDSLNPDSFLFDTYPNFNYLPNNIDSLSCKKSVKDITPPLNASCDQIPNLIHEKSELQRNDKLEERINTDNQNDVNTEVKPKFNNNFADSFEDDDIGTVYRIFNPKELMFPSKFCEEESIKKNLIEPSTSTERSPISLSNEGLSKKVVIADQVRSGFNSITSKIRRKSDEFRSLLKRKDSEDLLKDEASVASLLQNKGPVHYYEEEKNVVMTEEVTSPCKVNITTMSKMSLNSFSETVNDDNTSEPPESKLPRLINFGQEDKPQSDISSGFGDEEKSCDDAVGSESPSNQLRASRRRFIHNMVHNIPDSEPIYSNYSLSQRNVSNLKDSLSQQEVSNPNDMSQREVSNINDTLSQQELSYPNDSLAHKTISCSKKPANEYFLSSEKDNIKLESGSNKIIIADTSTYSTNDDFSHSHKESNTCSAVPSSIENNEFKDSESDIRVRTQGAYDNHSVNKSDFKQISNQYDYTLNVDASRCDFSQYDNTMCDIIEESTTLTTPVNNPELIIRNSENGSPAKYMSQMNVEFTDHSLNFNEIEAMASSLSNHHYAEYSLYPNIQTITCEAEIKESYLLGKNYSDEMLSKHDYNVNTETAEGNCTSNFLNTHSSLDSINETKNKESFIPNEENYISSFIGQVDDIDLISLKESNEDTNEAEKNSFTYHIAKTDSQPQICITPAETTIIAEEFIESVTSGEPHLTPYGMDSKSSTTMALQASSIESQYGSSTALSDMEVIAALDTRRDSPTMIKSYERRSKSPKSPTTVQEWIDSLPFSCNHELVDQEDDVEWIPTETDYFPQEEKHHNEVASKPQTKEETAEEIFLLGEEAVDLNTPKSKRIIDISTSESSLCHAPAITPECMRSPPPLTLSDIHQALKKDSGTWQGETTDKRSLFAESRNKQASFHSEASNVSCLSRQTEVSSLESLLESRQADPVDILLNLGFGAGAEDEGISRIPDRFIKPSKVPGNDINVFLKEEDNISDLVDSSEWVVPGISSQGGWSSTPQLRGAPSMPNFYNSFNRLNRLNNTESNRGLTPDSNSGKDSTCSGSGRISFKSDRSAPMWMFSPLIVRSLPAHERSQIFSGISRGGSSTSVRSAPSFSHHRRRSPKMSNSQLHFQQFLTVHGSSGLPVSHL